MQLGNFSVSLAVKDIQASKEFYGKLGFEVSGGDEQQGWLILRNDQCVIGLFQDMFPKNILTFNPGWNIDCEQLEQFQDVRELQKELNAKGIALEREAEAGSTGPASIVINDPDGNPILIDQHV